MAGTELARKAVGLLCAGALALGGAAAITCAVMAAPGGGPVPGIEQAQAKKLSKKQVKANIAKAKKKAVNKYLQEKYCKLKPVVKLKAVDSKIVATVTNIRVVYNGKAKVKYTYRNKNNKKVTKKAALKSYKGTVYGTKKIYAGLQTTRTANSDNGAWMYYYNTPHPYFKNPHPNSNAMTFEVDRDWFMGQVLKMNKDYTLYPWNDTTICKTNKFFCYVVGFSNASFKMEDLNGEYYTTAGSKWSNKVY